MRQLFGPRLLLLLIVALSAAHLPVAAEEHPGQIVTIAIADDVNCLVEGTRVPCADVVAYLRDVLKVPVRTQFRILADKASSYEATAKLFEQFQKSEYKLKMGYVNVAEDPKE